MATQHLDTDIDRLYQLPLAEFTAARNALARDAGARASEVRALQKPPVPAWAVNQIYWRDRDTYDALVGAARDLRQAHAALLAGKKADLRAASRVHEEALEAAVKSALELLRSEGHPATEATKQAVLTTLRALPSEEAPGRLARTLQPGGFEMLAGLPIRPGAKPAARAAEPAPRPVRADKAAKEEAAAAARKKEEAAEAARALRMAEHAAKREEFEAARAAREADKAERAVESARDALKEAERTLKEAEQAAADAEETRAAAERRSREAEAALKAARSRVSAR